MEHQILMSRIHFAFTIMFHYIFPKLTMGLALAMGLALGAEAFVHRAGQARRIARNCSLRSQPRTNGPGLRDSRRRLQWRHSVGLDFGQTVRHPVRWVGTRRNWQRNFDSAEAAAHLILNAESQPGCFGGHIDFLM
jgi:Cytochrome bd terminal oxidase subunit I